MSTPRPARPPRRRAALRSAAALLCFAAVHTYMDRVWAWHIADAVLRIGETCGGQVRNISGYIALGESGPFTGGRKADTVFNFVWRQRWAAAPLAGFAAAAGLSLILAGRAPPRTPGVTTCGWCGYALRGLREPRCPECGRAI